MREILFRAKRIDNGEWVEGNVIHSYDADEEYKAIIIPVKSSDMYTDTDDNDIGFETWNKVNPETLCQYTGLTDKNGNRIWENDIVRTTKFGKDDGNGHNYAGFDVFVVKWDDGGFALFNKWRRFNLRTDEKSYEILGKVFDNPELLKGE